MYSGYSGLSATSDELSVVGDNIANSQTVGFKASRTCFADAMTQQLVEGGGEQGLGVRTLTVQKLMAQGAFATTNQDTDCAIQGNGMFVLKGNYGGASGTFYSRNGQFVIGADGFLVNLQGLHVQGMQADPTGDISSGLLGDLQVGNASAPAKPTDNITVRGNLDAQAKPTENADATGYAGWTVTDAKDTSNFSTSMVVYDSLGKPVQLDIYFCMDTSGNWNYHAVTDGANLTGGTANTPSEVATGTLAFDTEGRLVSNTTTLNDFNPINASPAQPLTFNFGSGTADGGTGLDGITQYAAASAMSFVTQAGFTSGSLNRLSIGSDGKITGGFTNGQSRVLGQLVLGNFKAPDQLSRIGGSLYEETPQSGPGTLGTPATADRGSISAGTLEQSNVDIAQEFINMITAQRGFEANSKTLTTADQLMSDLMQIRR
jgi:flagellar hook protein FlgE